MSKTQNKMQDLHNHLFAQLERLDDDSLSAEDIEKEVQRTDAMCNVASQIINAGNLVVKAAKLNYDTTGAVTKLPEYLAIEANND